jgi:hypothetical protein
MLKSISRILAGAVLLAILGLVMTSSAARADDNQDYNQYWQEQNETPQQEQTELSQMQGNYNQYWQEAQEQQQQPPQ